MARMKPLDKAEAPEASRPLMEAAERALGKPSIPAGIQARCPPVLEASRALGGAMGRSGQLSGELRSLVCVRVAQIIGCEF
jgi:alkylhydroperoxidase family enzyme